MSADAATEVVWASTLAGLVANLLAEASTGGAGPTLDAADAVVDHLRAAPPIAGATAEAAAVLARIDGLVARGSVLVAQTREAPEGRRAAHAARVASSVAALAEGMVTMRVAARRARVVATPPTPANDDGPPR